MMISKTVHDQEVDITSWSGIQSISIDGAADTAHVVPKVAAMPARSVFSLLERNITSDSSQSGPQSSQYG
jgi:hypothetical protein